jgi:hypothetical protein
MDRDKTRGRLLPSPAMTVALVALVAAMGGAAIAATVAPKNSVVSKSIKKGQVKSSDLKDNGAKGKDVKEDTLDFSCGGGKEEFAGACWDSSDRTADDWQSAAEDCGDERGRLPNIGELIAAIQPIGVDIGQEAWSDTVAPGDVAFIVDTSSLLPQSADLDSNQTYRCVFPLVD